MSWGLLYLSLVQFSPSTSDFYTRLQLKKIFFLLGDNLQTYRKFAKNSIKTPVFPLPRFTHVNVGNVYIYHLYGWTSVGVSQKHTYFSLNHLMESYIHHGPFNVFKGEVYFLKNHSTVINLSKFNIATIPPFTFQLCHFITKKCSL